MYQHLTVILTLAATLAVNAAAMTPDGFYYERNDLHQSNSEPLYFTYKVQKDEKNILEQGVKFQINSLRGENVVTSQSTNFSMIDGLAVYRLLPPQAMQGWPDGWYELAIAPARDENYFKMKFHFINRKNAAPVVYLIDNVTPEGYAEWLNGSRAGAIEPLKSFPDGREPGLVVMSHYRPLSPDTIRNIEQFLNRGGILVMFGDNNSNADSFSPLKINRTNPYNLHSDKVIETASGSAITLDNWAGQEIYTLNTVLADGAVAYAFTTGHKPLLAVKQYGRGRVIAVAAPLKPDIFYNTIIASLLKIPPAPAAIRENINADGFSEGISLGNIGRFGWMNNDRVNEMGIMPDFSFRMWDINPDTFRIDFPPYDSGNAAKVSCAEASWTGKKLTGSGGCFGSRTELYFGLCTPGVLYRNAAAESLRFRIPAAAMLAYPAAAGVKVISVKPGETIRPAGMDRNWLLFWSGSPDRRQEWPLLMSVNRKIKTITRSSNDIYEIEFTATGIDVSVMPLAGIKHFTRAETDLWNPLPEAIRSAADFWSRSQSNRITGCRETFRLDPERKMVEIRNTYEYLNLDNDWHIAGISIAPVPPLVPLNAEQGLAFYDSTVSDTGFRTFCGPLYAVKGGNTSIYRLPLPDLSYPLAVKTTDPKVGFPPARDLFQRICDHIDIPKTIYLPIRFSVVEKAKDQIYPDRDLQPAVMEKSAEDVRDRLFIDLHRNLGGTFGDVMFKPYLDAMPGFDATKAIVNRKINRNLLQDITFFQYKTFLDYRTEPNGGGKYLMSFLGPVRFADGYRIFHDMNETGGIVLYSFYVYSLIAGDQAFLRGNQDYIDATAAYFNCFNDWAWMSSMAVEWGMGNNIDMLNAELPAWAALYHIRTRLNDPAGADFAAYMAAKAAVSTSARFFFSDYYNSLHFPDLLKLKPETHEMANMQVQQATKGKFLPYGLTNGYGEGWPSLWPNDMYKGYLSFNLAGLDIYNHSKGVCPEILSAYRNPAVMKVLSAYEKTFRDACHEKNLPVLYSRIACYNALAGDSKDMLMELYLTLNSPGATAKILGAGLADWEVSSMAFLLEQLRCLALQEPGKITDSANVTFPLIVYNAVTAAKWEAAGKPLAVIAGSERGLKITMPARAASTDTVCAFTSFPKSRLTATHKYLSLTFKNCSGGTLEVVLPDRNWSAPLRKSLQLKKSAERQNIRLSLTGDLGMKNSGSQLPELRGELFLYHKNPPESPAPLEFQLEEIAFE